MYSFLLLCNIPIIRCTYLHDLAKNTKLYKVDGSSSIDKACFKDLVKKDNFYLFAKEILLCILSFVLCRMEIIDISCIYIFEKKSKHIYIYIYIHTHTHTLEPKHKKIKKGFKIKNKGKNFNFGTLPKPIYIYIYIHTHTH